MTTHSLAIEQSRPHPVSVAVPPALESRNRLTTAFRIVLAVPHLLLVGGPIAATLFWTWTPEAQLSWAGGGALGTAVGVAAVIAWFAIVFTGRYPAGLRNLATFYLRWRVRAVVYTSLLADEYPRFGDGPYPAALQLEAAAEPRDRVSVAWNTRVEAYLLLLHDAYPPCSLEQETAA